MINKLYAMCRQMMGYGVMDIDEGCPKFCCHAAHGNYTHVLDQGLESMR